MAGVGEFRLLNRGDHWQIRFQAMASPCEVLLDLDDDPDGRLVAEHMARLAVREAHRIEAKFSRYREDNIVHRINTAIGEPVTVDDETADLLDFAARCFALSNGRFDITSGILRNAWIFDGSDRIPTRGRVKTLLPLVGWDKLTWRRPELRLPAGMEIDLGGIGKEYAVDRVAGLLTAPAAVSPLRSGPVAALVNFGGDLRARLPRRDGAPWRIGVERPGLEEVPALQLVLQEGGLATSGDARRFLQRGGVRYPHILNPRTGWPVLKAPRSVTALADSCTEAGLLATLAMLKGAQAEAFLEAQDVRCWVIR